MNTRMWLPRCVDVSIHFLHAHLLLSWFQLFSDRLVSGFSCSNCLSEMSHFSIFNQAYYESNLDAFPGSRKERKTVPLKRVTGEMLSVLSFFWFTNHLCLSCLTIRRYSFDERTCGGTCLRRNYDSAR